MITAALVIGLAISGVSDSSCIINLTSKQISGLKIQLYRQWVDTQRKCDSLEKVIGKMEKEKRK